MQDLVLFSSEALAERFHARGSSQGPRFGIDALAELGAQAGWLLLAELGAGMLVDVGGAHVISMPFGSFSCQQNSGCRSTNGRS